MKRREFVKCAIVFGITFKNEINIKFITISTDLKNKLKLLKAIDISVESTEGGSILCYYDSSENLKKFEVAQYWESGKLIANVYVEKDRIRKISETTIKYNRPFYYDKELALSYNDTECFDDTRSKTTLRELLIEDNMIYENKSYRQCIAENIDLFKLKHLYDKRLLTILNSKTV